MHSIIAGNSLRKHNPGDFREEKNIHFAALYRGIYRTTQWQAHPRIVPIAIKQHNPLMPPDLIERGCFAAVTKLSQQNLLTCFSLFGKSKMNCSLFCLVVVGWVQIAKRQ